MLLQSDARHIPLPDESVQCIVTSPPYWGLRDYGLNGSGIGLESTLNEYIENMRAVGRELWRVLREDGCLFLNLGDAYCGGGRGGNPDEASYRKQATNVGSLVVSTVVPRGLKPKDLIGLPWRVAFALQADGWYLRSDIIWAKPNPMPESVTDRPTRAHEYVFLLTKNARYYYDAEAVKEEGSATSGGGQQRAARGNRAHGNSETAQGDGLGGVGLANVSRNRRTVWTISTAPFKGAHFAVFPEKLVEPCILAGSSPKACGVCGAPWERAIEHKANYEKRESAHAPKSAPTKVDSTGWRPPTITDHGWRPTCEHGGDWEIVNTPTGSGAIDDLTLVTGRAGMNRPRREGEGRRPMYRWQQKAYAEQLRNSPHRATMEGEAGSAFDHYIRTDKSGARPVPPEMLEGWLERGWLTEPNEPPPPDDTGKCLVLDPFCGSGTTGVVALKHRRRFVGLDLSRPYLKLAEERLLKAPIGLL